MQHLVLLGLFCFICWAIKGLLLSESFVFLPTYRDMKNKYMKECYVILLSSPDSGLVLVCVIFSQMLVFLPTSFLLFFHFFPSWGGWGNFPDRRKGIKIHCPLRCNEKLNKEIKVASSSPNYLSSNLMCYLGKYNQKIYIDIDFE